MHFTRRETLTLAAAATVAGVAGIPSLALAKEGDQLDQLKLAAVVVPDKIDGNPDAKVTFIEYAAPSCPHCARFSNTVLQSVLDKYVKTGKVKYILRPFMLHTIDAAIFMLAIHAADAANGTAAPSTDASAASAADASASAPAAPANPGGYSPAAVAAYENVISTFFRTQETWGTSDKPLDAIKAVAVQLGFTDDSFTAALKDQDLFTKLQTMTQQAANDFGLEGTPTFYVNGKQLTGEKTLDELSAAIDPLL